MAFHFPRKSKSCSLALKQCRSPEEPWPWGGCGSRWCSTRILGIVDGGQGPIVGLLCRRQDLTDARSKASASSSESRRAQLQAHTQCTKFLGIVDGNTAGDIQGRCGRTFGKCLAMACLHGLLDRPTDSAVLGVTRRACPSPSRRRDDKLRIGVHIDVEVHRCLLHDSINHLRFHLGHGRGAMVGVCAWVVRGASFVPMRTEVAVEVHTDTSAAGVVFQVLAMHAISRGAVQESIWVCIRHEDDLCACQVLWVCLDFCHQILNCICASHTSDPLASVELVCEEDPRSTTAVATAPQADDVHVAALG